MGVFFRKQNEVFVFTGIAKLAIVGLIVALSTSLVNTVWSVYVNSFVQNTALVGLISAFFTIVSFFAFFLFIPFVEKKNKIQLYSWTLALFAVAYILFAINSNFFIFLLIAFAMILLATLRITSFGIIIRDCSKQKQLSRNEGLMYTFFNIAWVIGPLLSGFIAEAYGISTIFVLSAIFVLIALLFFRYSRIENKNIKKVPDTNMIQNFLDFFKDKERRISYFIGAGAPTWWVMIYLFMPLMIIQSGLGGRWVGYFLFAVAVPLILLEYVFAKSAGRFGFKKMFYLGFLIALVMQVLCFIFSSNIYAVLTFLVIGSIGMAMIEPTTESYFFHIVGRKEETRFYGPYNTTIDVGQFVAKILPTLLFFIIPNGFKYMFLMFAVFMLLFLIISSRAKTFSSKK